uniref:Phage tail protein n=1 Tax=Caudovirales sp. ctu3532 TaxID=2827639 RepID=A0A8S5TI05_9CAUD|nr:MAG TPA: hypothetical protein [Caudovirales sp. ctu3532]
MVGSYLGRVFTVSGQRIFTPSNLKGSTGSDWANHEIIGSKTRSQWVGPKLKSYTMDILLRAQDGVNPRATLEYFQRAAESQMVDYFVIGGRPLGESPFKLVSISDEWDAVLGGGQLIECKVSLSIEEYA